MKKYIYNILVILILVVPFIGCEEDLDFDFNVTATPNPVTVGEPVTFNIVGDLPETYVIYTGDEGHEFDKSYLVITEGKDIDQEELVLTSDSLQSLLSWLSPVVVNYNNNIPDSIQPINFDTAYAGLEDMVGLTFIDAQNLRYKIKLLLPGLSIEILDQSLTFFTNNSVLLAPEGGFSTGIPINRYEGSFEYSYNTAGTYKATIIGTMISSKKYSGSGYRNDRTSSADEYDYNRVIKEITIKVN